MSKAFTKETDSDDEELRLPPLPAGGKNYITPTVTAQKTVTTFTAKNACVKLTVGFVF
jgi:hypothetical protein